MITEESKRKMLDCVKGIAKRAYYVADVTTGILHWETPGDWVEGYPISVGIYYPTPTAMLDAGIKYMKEVKAKKGRLSPPGRYWTPNGRGYVDNVFLDLIADKLKKENNLDVDPDTEVILSAGVSPALFTVPMILCNPGDEVLVMDPDYVRLRNHKIWGTKEVVVPLKERQGVTDESRWYFDPDELESRITEKSKLFIFCNPNNPVGYVYSKSDLNAIARIAKKYDLFVLTNECYERMWYTDEFSENLVFNSIAAIPGMKERTFTTQGVTKAYETEGNALIGWIIGPPEHLKIMQWLQFALCQKSGTAVGGYMGIGALTSPAREDYVRQQLNVYCQTREMLWETLNQFSWIECGKPMGGCFVFPDITGSGMDEESFARFLSERGVGPSIGTAWGAEIGKGHERFAFCSPIDYQREMNTKLEQVLKEYEVQHKDLIIE
jgi:aspartate/methionine/tyrosine aminotransferase